MLAKKYKSEIVSIQNPLDGIYTLEFKTLGRKYKYYQGQFLHLAIDSEYDSVGQWPESRCFSIQSNPDEENIKITYAVKGYFTSLMRDTLSEGDEVWLKLPYGDLFQQPHKKQNTVFIGGGTGITPFLSLFTHESFNEYTNPRIYIGFRSKEYNIYNEELNRMIQIRSETLAPELIEGNSSGLLSGFVKSYYEDRDGILNIEKIFEENSPESNYFISGPPAMIKSFKNTLIEKGVPTENILTDDWE
ncbi:MAG: FAD-dependent oxidoreductase [Bacteroidales bacterium]|jgi:NAD(P)H-flavin reductase|nr:FAD-dependent oxidoreductase [Bacteroidales bacterium]